MARTHGDRRNGRHEASDARAKGYEDEACNECGNFTLVRNGTWIKCDTCGAVSDSPSITVGTPEIVRADGTTDGGKKKRVLPVVPIADAINQ